jgi:hypothetical protein
MLREIVLERFLLPGVIKTMEMWQKEPWNPPKVSEMPQHAGPKVV